MGSGSRAGCVLRTVRREEPRDAAERQPVAELCGLRPADEAGAEDSFGQLLLLVVRIHVDHPLAEDVDVVAEVRGELEGTFFHLEGEGAEPLSFLRGVEERAVAVAGVSGELRRRSDDRSGSGAELFRLLALGGLEVGLAGVEESPRDVQDHSALERPLLLDDPDVQHPLLLAQLLDHERDDDAAATAGLVDDHAVESGDGQAVADGDAHLLLPELEEGAALGAHFELAAIGLGTGDGPATGLTFGHPRNNGNRHLGHLYLTCRGKTGPGI
jgi:hypothetical protein